MRRLVPALAVLVVLAGTAYWLSVREKKQARAERVESRLLAFDDRQVRALTLTVRGVRWRFERAPEGWKVVEPVRDAADDVTVVELIGAARRTPVARVVDDPEGMSSYGLDPPVAAIRLEGVDVPALEIGDRDPTGEGLFARVQGRPGVLVLDADQGRTLTAIVPERMRDRSPTGVLLSEVLGVDLRTPEGSISLQREADGWWIREPLRVPAGDREVDTLLRTLDQAKIVAFDDAADPREPARGLSPPRLEAELRTAAGARTIRLGAEAGAADRRWATRDDRPGVMTYEIAGTDRISPSVGGFAGDQLTRVNRYAVVRLVFVRGDERFEAIRQGKDAWTSAGRSVPPDEVYGFLVRVLNASVTGFDASASAKEPEVEASLDFEVETGPSDRIEFLGGRRARVRSIPGVVYRLGDPVIPIPPRMP